jgi:translation elongation factor P/translation initiation factor 5A
MQEGDAAVLTKTAKQVNVGDLMIIDSETMAVEKTESTLFCCGGGKLIHLSLKNVRSGRETYATFRPDETVGELAASGEPVSP